MPLRNKVWRVIPYTFKTIKRLLLFLFARWLLKAVLTVVWYAPAHVWGGWVVLGAYGLVLGFVGVMLHLMAFDRWFAYGILWGYCSRWRWNYSRLSKGVRPLFERRDDLCNSQNSHFILGYGREVSARTKIQRIVTSMPLYGPALEQSLWPPQPVSTEGADSPSILIVAAGGKGKTLLGDQLCDDALQQGSLVLLNGGGPLYTYFVRRCVQQRISPHRICLIEPTYRTDELGSPLFHWLQPLPGYKAEEVVEAFVTDTMMMSHRMSTPGPRQADLAYYLFRLLQLEQRPVSDLHTILYNVPIRQAWIDRCPEKATREYWQYFTTRLNPNQQATWLSPVANKWSPVLRSPFTAPMFSSTTTTIPIERVVNTKGMALPVELSSQRLGTEVSETLAQVLFSRLKLAILQRSSIPPQYRIPLTILVDEYSLIQSPVVPILYRLVRNMNVTVIVMVQDVSIFDEESLRSICGSTGSIMVMGCGEKEAERLCLELYRPTGTKRKSWKEERYYSPHEELYIFQDHLSKDKQKPQQAVCLVNPKGLYFLKTHDRQEPVENPTREAVFKEEVARYWWQKPSRPGP